MTSQMLAVDRSVLSLSQRSCFRPSECPVRHSNRYAYVPKRFLKPE